MDQDGSILCISGEFWALDESVTQLKAATSKKSSETSSDLQTIILKNFDVDIPLAAIVADLVRSKRTVKDLVLHQCSGHVDIVLTVALATSSTQLEALTIFTGNFVTDVFCPSAHALGVGLQINSSLRSLTLSSGPNVFFTMSTQAATSLELGMIGNTTLGTFHLERCRFTEIAAIQALSRGIRGHGLLRSVRIQSCFASNGHPLDDDSMSFLIGGLEHITRLTHLDLSRNKCLQRSLSSLSSLIDRTQVRQINLSGQHVNRENDEFMDLSLLVGALGRTSTLHSLDLSYNKLSDRDMAYVSAALTHNTSITHVDLSGNKIMNLGINILCSRIPSMPVLQSLVLKNNSFDDEGAEDLVNAMKHNLILGRLDCDPDIPLSKTIRYYADLNWSGRRFVHPGNSEIPIHASLWPVILARVSQLREKRAIGIKERHATVLYYLLRQSVLSIVLNW